MTETYNELKNRALEKYFERMNDRQRQAVFKLKGPLLILAGAGSGKTTVLINRIANMIHFGDAYNNEQGYGTPDEEDLRFLRDYADGRETDSERLAEIIAFETVKPYNILAITFTNKAANELKERICNMLGEEGEGVTACTFHSLCARLLRRECEHIGYGKSFTIYDTDDSLRVIKAITKDMDLNDKIFRPKDSLALISAQKNMMLAPGDMMVSADNFQMQTVAKIYDEYQRRLTASNAMDFDDLLCNTVRLFEQNEDVLRHYQHLYKYIMVDEYQDTNPVQFKLVELLARKYNNLCVVGDDDQSIYRFRGATIENILSFEKTFHCDPKRDVIRLEQNYRSTQNILTCANKLIKNNRERKGKELWTDAGDGEKVVVYTAENEKGEAAFIAETVLDSIGKDGHYNDNAVLYRTNAQSREIEHALSKSGIPYRIYGGLRFYDRKEIKDVLAYLQVINNESDMLRLRRIINEPKRGIGDATVDSIEQIASDLGITPVEVMMESEDFAPVSRRASRLRPLAEMFRYFEDIAETMKLPDLLDELLEKTGYKAMLEADGEEGQGRLENIEELKTSMNDYEGNAEEPTLSGYLEEIALYTDIDRMDANDDVVSLMTMHAAKGLEFKRVFVAGMEENLFPSSRSTESESDIEEERRLAYVAITRAKRELYLIHAEARMLYGSTQYNRVSRFIKELPSENIDKRGEVKAASGSGFAPIRSSSLQNQMAQKRQSFAAAGVLEDFSVGDRVTHKIFGDGTVLGVSKMSNDALLEIAFDSRGTKKVMARFAKIRKI